AGRAAKIGRAFSPQRRSHAWRPPHPLPATGRRNRRWHPQRLAAAGGPAALGAPDLRAARRQPVHGVPGLCPARVAGAGGGPGPHAARTSEEAGPVAISELVFELLGSTRDADVVPLGSAFPAAHLFPFEALARSGARAMRRLPASRITGALTAGDEGLRQILR